MTAAPTWLYRAWLRVTDQPSPLQLHQMDCNEARCQPWTDRERVAVERFRAARDERRPVEEMYRLVKRYCAGEMSAEDYFAAVEVRARQMVEDEVRDS